MKKTLIAIMALTGAVVAEEASITLTSATTVSSKNAALTWAESSAPLTLTSWEVAFDLELVNKENKTGIGDAPIFTTTRAGGTSNGIIFSSNTNGTVEIYHSSGVLSNNSTQSVLSIGNSTSITMSFVADYDYVLEEYIGGTFLVTSGETELLNFTVGKTIQDTTLKSGHASVWTQTGDAGCPSNNLFTNITVKRLADNVVPEPTTATLSLLALTGLAARRRRR